MDNYSCEFLKRRKHLLNGLAIAMIDDRVYLSELRKLIKMELLGILGK